mmetsp:Transcript_119332/g.194024  ORF Transcript_119332/g.194024 Transcript_119332/m.194024 type:complete len:491 (-) Transcript_119332:197-1669(-)
MWQVETKNTFLQLTPVVEKVELQRTSTDPTHYPGMCEDSGAVDMQRGAEAKDKDNVLAKTVPVVEEVQKDDKCHLAVMQCSSQHKVRVKNTFVDVVVEAQPMPLRRIVSDPPPSSPSDESVLQEVDACDDEFHLELYASPMASFWGNATFSLEELEEADNVLMEACVRNTFINIRPSEEAESIQRTVIDPQVYARSCEASFSQDTAHEDGSTKCSSEVSDTEETPDPNQKRVFNENSLTLSELPVQEASLGTAKDMQIEEREHAAICVDERLKEKNVREEKLRRRNAREEAECRTKREQESRTTVGKRIAVEVEIAKSQPKPRKSMERSARRHRQSQDAGPEADSHTTLRLTYLPPNLKREHLVTLLHLKACFLYDLIYVPRDMRKQNTPGLGYAFVNFLTSAAAKDASEKLEGFNVWKQLGSFTSPKVCKVDWGTRQGLHNNIQFYRNSSVMHDDVPDECKPALYHGEIRVPFPPPEKKVRPPKIRNLE